MELTSVAMIFLNVFLVIVVPIIIGMAIFGALVVAYSLHIGVHVIYPLWVSDYIPLLAKGFVLVIVFWCGDKIISIVLTATIGVVNVAILFYVSILLFELVVQVISVCWYYFFDKSPSLSSKKGKWDLLTIIRSYNNGYASKQFFPANIVDPVTQEPTHVFVFEVIRRTFSWKQVKVWNVSLNDQKVQEMVPLSFDLVSVDLPFKRFYNPGPVYTFQSNDVLFMLLTDTRIGVVASSPFKVLTDMRGGLVWSSSKMLLVADLVHGRTATIELDDPTFHEILVSVSCQERLEEDGRLLGWKVIFLTARIDQEGHVYNPVLVKTVMDLKVNGDVHQVSQPVEAVLGSFENKYELRPIRSSDGLFGVIFIDDDEDDGTIMLYDTSNQVFLSCSSLFELAELDKGFKKYMINHLSEDPSPVYLSKQQAIEVLRDGSVYRTDFPNPMVNRQAESTPDVPDANLPRQLISDRVIM